MKKLLALILGLSMMLGIAACGKKVEVPSKSDVKKAAAEEYDMEFTVDSEDIADDEKSAEWVLISKDGTLELTVTWNSKKPDEFAYEEEEHPEATETDETEPAASADTSETTEQTTTAAPETTPATSEDTSAESSSSDSTASTVNVNGTKFVNFDEMNFYINGVKYTLGKTTLQDMIDAGAPFKDGELENAKNNVKSHYQSAPIKLDIGSGYNVSVYCFNETDSGKPMNECYINEIYVHININSSEQQTKLTFDFPLSLSMDDLKANAGEPTEKPYHNEDNPKYTYDYLEYTKKSKKFMNRNRYRFEFTNGKLQGFYMTYIP